MTTPLYTNWSEAALRDAAAAVVEEATRLGADAVSATAQAGGGARFVARDGVIETRVRDGGQSLGVTVYREGRSGSASTTALDPASIARIAAEAIEIAGHVQPEETGGLADRGWLAMEGVSPPMFASSGHAPDVLMAMALEVEAEVARVPRAGAVVRVTEAGIATQEGMMALATSAGFCRSAASTHHGRWAMVLAEGTDGAVQDYAQSADRRFDRLDPPAVLAALAVERATAQLGARPMAGGRMPVLFAPRVAPAIVGDLVMALSGGPQERGASFLTGALGTAVAAAHLDLAEDPFEPFGLASSGFDGEGVAGRARMVIDGGVATGYFLSSRPARRLGMRSTGNAGGPYNLRLTSRTAGGDAEAMLARLGDGLLVTQLLGGATDPVTGNWTRAVAGFRVIGGRIADPVTDVTLGGHMPDMLRAIEAVGDDVERHGAVRSGSILIDGMMVGGTA